MKSQFALADKPEPTSTIDVKFHFNPELDTILLCQNFGNNLNFGQKMFRTFIDTIDTDIQELESGINRMDYEAIQKVTHKIKNNFSWVGLPLLSKLTCQLELSANNHSEEVTTQYTKLKALLDANYSTIKEELKRINTHLNSLK